MYALTNCDVFTGTTFEHDKAVVVEGTRIRDVMPVRELPSTVELIDLEGQTVTAAVIDIQVNGGGNRLFNDSPDVETLRTIVTAHRRFGTTNPLPTFITGSTDGMYAAASAVKELVETKDTRHTGHPFRMTKHSGKQGRRSR